MTDQLQLAHLFQLSDDQLVSSLRRLVQQQRSTTAAVLAHLIEVDRRQLHLAAACSSLFAYCTEVLGLSDHEALDRIHAARAAKRFPVVLDLLAANKLHLTAVRLLAPHLDHDNHRELLDAAAGKTKRQLQVLIAERAPKPDVPARIRKRPSRTQAATPTTATAPDLFELADQVEPASASALPKPRPGGRTADQPPAPLAPDRYKVEFTASEALVTKLRQCEGLLGHRQPGCGVAEVFEQAIELLHAKLVKERFAVGAKKRKPSTKRSKAAKAKGAAGSGRSNGSRSRRVPAEVRREVVERDGLRCAYVDPATGRRCSECSRLELQHHEPFAFGGAHSADNVSVYCAAHNRWAARKDFGEAAIAATIERARQRPRGSAAAAAGTLAGR